MKSPSRILNFTRMDEKDEDSYESDFLLDTDIKFNISNLISRLEDETSIDSLEEIKLKAKSENLSTNSGIKCELKTDNNNLNEFVKPFKTDKKLTLKNRSKPLKTNGFEQKVTPNKVAEEEVAPDQKLPSHKQISEEKSKNITKSKYEFFQNISLDDLGSLENLGDNCKIKVQNFKPFIGNKNFYEGIFIKSLKKRMENHDKESQSPEQHAKKKYKKSELDEIQTNLAHLEDVKVREIVNCDLIKPSTDFVTTPKINLSPLKSILTNSPSATPNSTSSSMKTPKKVTFCNLIFVKNIEVDYEAEYGPNDDDFDSYDDDDDSDDEDFTL